MFHDRVLHLVNLLLRVDVVSRHRVREERVALALERRDLIWGQRLAALLLSLETLLQRSTTPW